MKKTRKNSGFSLIEMMCALLILVLLVMGMGVGMEAGGRIYQDAIFESESATLAGILNTSLGDILRYAIDVRELDLTEDSRVDSDIPQIFVPKDPADAKSHMSSVHYVFTSVDYGIQDAYFYIPPHVSGETKGCLEMKSLRNPAINIQLVNTGAYPDLVVSDMTITFYERVAPGIQGGYFEISYTISSESAPSKTRSVGTIVRLMND